MSDMRRILAAVAVLAATSSASCKATPYREVVVDLASSAPARSAAPRDLKARRFAIAAMESPTDTHAGYSRLLGRLGVELGGPVELVQRRTYAEVDDMLLGGGVDAALICTGGYLDLRKRAPEGFEVLAIPVIDGATTYSSLVIVPASSEARALEDLASRRFAFTDELSFSGRLYVVQRLRAIGKEPDPFFGSTLFTHSHDRSIKAVADGLVDGAVVHSVIYEHLRERDPTLVGKTRVVDRSPQFGMMPVVASTALPSAERARLRDVLLRLHDDPDAKAAMASLHIDRFVVAPSGLYDSAIALAEGKK
jgi:phosphonate transport system substrate-binding protein